jgi:N-acetylmuramoyl-L-alanine amidase
MRIEDNAGHGGKDPGAIGKRGTREKDFNLDIALRLGEELEKLGQDVNYTRTKDEFVELNTIADKANKNKADLFVSIHCDSVEDATVGGISTFHYPGSIKGKEYATKIQTELIKATGLKDRGVKEANYAVLKNTNMPGVLIECGFISNPQEEILLMSTEYRDKVAKSIAYAITGKKSVPKVVVHDEKINIVLLTQKFLNQLEIKDHEGKKLIEDGLIGKRTEMAYKKLGERLGI